MEPFGRSSVRVRYGQKHEPSAWFYSVGIPLPSRHSARRPSLVPPCGRVLRRCASVLYVTARHPSEAFHVNGIGNFLCCVKPIGVFQPKLRIPVWHDSAEKFPTFRQCLLKSSATLQRV